MAKIKEWENNLVCLMDKDLERILNGLQKVTPWGMFSREFEGVKTVQRLVELEISRRKTMDKEKSFFHPVEKSYPVTDLEFDLMKAIVNSEFHDGQNVIDHPVWSFSACPQNIRPNQMGGVMSSLVKKDYVRVEGEGDDATVEITAIGFDAFSWKAKDNEEKAEDAAHIAAGA